MSDGTKKGLPGIEVWVEPIDDTHYALFVCRRWDEAPRLTVWSIMEKPADRSLRDVMWYGARGWGVAMLLEKEQGLHPRWYKWAQRQVVRKAEEGWPLTNIAEVGQWEGLNARPRTD